MRNAKQFSMRLPGGWQNSSLYHYLYDHFRKYVLNNTWRVENRKAYSGLFLVVICILLYMSWSVIQKRVGKRNFHFGIGTRSQRRILPENFCFWHRRTFHRTENFQIRPGPGSKVASPGTPLNNERSDPVHSLLLHFYRWTLLKETYLIKYLLYKARSGGIEQVFSNVIGRAPHTRRFRFPSDLEGSLTFLPESHLHVFRK